MAQEDHSQRHSNTSSGGGGSGGGGGGGGGGGVNDHHRCSKKLKQKKVPQRGLGVAQLEKIRLEEEEEQKKDVSSSILPPKNSLISPSNSSNCLAFRPTISPPPLVQLPRPPPCPNNLPSRRKAMDSGGSEIGWLTGGFGFMKNVRLPYESNTPTWTHSNVVQQEGSQLFQQPCSSSMVNVSTTGSSSSLSASVLNFQMEPPSNQSYCGNNITPPFWPEEDKMVGMKRSYPFVLEDVQIPEFHCKLPSSFVSPISRSDDESASCGNGGKTSIEPSYQVIREEPLNSSAMSPRPKKVGQENGGRLKGDFLTLALPETHSTKQSLLQCQEDNPISGQGGSLKQETLISFFPPAKTDTTGLAISRRSSNGETGECVDLNLKL